MQKVEDKWDVEMLRKYPNNITFILSFYLQNRNTISKRIELQLISS